MKDTTKPNRFLAAAFAATLPGQASPIEVPNWNFEVPRSDLPDGLVDGADVYIVPNEQSWHQYNYNNNGGTAVYWNPGVPGVNDGERRWADVGFGGIAPEGDHVGLAVTRWNDQKLPDGNTVPIGDYVRDFEAIGQVLEDVLFDPNETYTLTVKVGHLPSTVEEGGGTIETHWNGYKVQLLAGGEESNDRGTGTYAPTILESSGGIVIAEDDNTVTIAANTFETITVTYTPGDLTTEQEAALAGLPIQIRLGAYEDPLDHSTNSIAAFDEVLLDGPAPPPPPPPSW